MVNEERIFFFFFSEREREKRKEESDFVCYHCLIHPVFRIHLQNIFPDHSVDLDSSPSDCDSSDYPIKRLPAGIAQHEQHITDEFGLFNNDDEDNLTLFGKMIIPIELGGETTSPIEYLDHSLDFMHEERNVICLIIRVLASEE